WVEPVDRGGRTARGDTAGDEQVAVCRGDRRIAKPDGQPGDELDVNAVVGAIDLGPRGVAVVTADEVNGSTAPCGHEVREWMRETSTDCGSGAPDVENRHRRTACRRAAAEDEEPTTDERPGGVVERLWHDSELADRTASGVKKKDTVRRPLRRI